MRKKHYVFLGLIALILAGMSFLNNKSTKASVKKEKKTEHEVHQDTVNTVAASPRKKLFTITQTELKHLRDSLPDVEQVKEEVKADPHRTPQSLLNFAKSMGPLMEKALKDEDDAAILVNALSDCALNERGAHAGRVLCMTNSERLAQNYPQLKTKVNDLRKNVDPEVKKILEKQDSLEKRD